MKTTLIRGTVTSVATVVLAISSSGASAAPQVSESSRHEFNGAPYLHNPSGVPERDIEELAKGLEHVFTRYLQENPDGTLSVNEANVISDGLGKELPAFQGLAGAVNSLDSTNEDLGYSATSPEASVAGVGEFASCVALSALGIPIGNAPGLLAAIKEGLRAWNWGLTARTVARILGPAAVKALGGPVGITLALGWSAVTCRDKL